MKLLVWTMLLMISLTAARAQVNVVDVDALPAQAPQVAYTPDQLDQLVGPIALYPDPLLAQVLPASTYPLDVVRAARLVHGGSTIEQIEQENFDLSVKAVAHYPTALDLLDSNLEWTQELGQAFVSDPDGVMQAVQRQRDRASQLGNLASSPQQQVVVEDQYIRILPPAPDVIYVPVYQPDVVYVERPVYQPLVTFGVAVFLGGFLDLDCDWGHHVVIHPGWTWNHWHDNIVVERDRVVRVHRPEAREPHELEWRRDRSRPLVLPGHAITPARFNGYRGDVRERPREMPTPRPVPDRGRAGQERTERPMDPSRAGTDVQRFSSRGSQSMNRPAPPAPQAPRAAPAPEAPRPAPSPAPKPAPSAPAPSHVGEPGLRGTPGPTPASTRPGVPGLRAAPARVTPPPVHVAPPPAPASAPPFVGRPAQTGNRPSAPAAPPGDNRRKG